ncbi:MAG TPA: hypothetical protein VN849_04640 [Stellaceae bacterium]|nr:hypothetical protein [Stellaceae bacterium]
MASIATVRRRALSRPVVREAFIELVATAFLLIAVVGSGIMAERLSASPCSPMLSQRAAL